MAKSFLHKAAASVARTAGHFVTVGEEGDRHAVFVKGPAPEGMKRGGMPESVKRHLIKQGGGARSARYKRIGASTPADQSFTESVRNQRAMRLRRERAEGKAAPAGKSLREQAAARVAAKGRGTPERAARAVNVHQTRQMAAAGKLPAEAYSGARKAYLERKGFKATEKASASTSKGLSDQSRRLLGQARTIRDYDPTAPFPEARKLYGRVKTRVEGRYVRDMEAKVAPAPSPPVKPTATSGPRAELAAKIRAARKERESDVRGDKLREAEPLRVAARKARYDAKAGEVTPEIRTRIAHALEKGDRENRGTDFVKLTQIRRELPDLPRPTVDKALREMRMGRELTANSHEGLYSSLTKAERRAGIKEAGSNLTYISRGEGYKAPTVPARPTLREQAAKAREGRSPTRDDRRAIAGSTGGVIPARVGIARIPKRDTSAEKAKLARMDAAAASESERRAKAKSVFAQRPEGADESVARANAADRLRRMREVLKGRGTRKYSQYVPSVKRVLKSQ